MNNQRVVPTFHDLRGRTDKPYSSLDVPKYAPYKDGKGQLDDGLKPIGRLDGLTPIFDIDKFWPYYMNRKHELFNTCPDVVYQDVNKKKMLNTHSALASINFSEVSCIETGFPYGTKNPNWDDWKDDHEDVFDLVKRTEDDTHIRFQYRNFFGGPLIDIWGEVYGPKYGLKELALTVQEDLCILRRRDNGWVLRAAAVCFPSYWSLKDKINKPLQTTPENNCIDMSKLDGLEWRGSAESRGISVERFNWTLTSDSELHQPLPYSPYRKPIPKNRKLCNFGLGMGEIFVRVERQTFTKLRSDDILFTTRTYLNSLGGIIQDREASVGLHDSIMKTPMEDLVYRGIARLNLLGSQVLRHIDKAWSDNRTCPGTHIEYHK